MTNVFPQLKTGAMAQFPIVRRRRWRYVTNVLADGTMISYSDPAPLTNVWEIALRDLTDAEAQSIQDLFQTVEGRRDSFLFVDPTANLLAHSEELGASSWTKGPMLQATYGIDDPLGGSRAIRLVNAAQAAQAVAQSVPAPAWYGYCFSVYARSASNGAVTLARAASGSVHSRVFQPGPGWSRCVLSGALNVTDTGIQFALELPAGASVDVFGIQVEAQPAPSAYKSTGNRDGVYTARFDQDALRLVSDGPDQHRLDLRILARD
jgi:hypothetical protein